MKSFKTHIEESLNRPYKWAKPGWNSNNNKKVWRAEFVTDDGAKYSFIAKIGQTLPEIWGIEFSLMNPPDRKGETQALTGTEGGKGALRVFATIKNMVDSFVEDVDPDKFQFAADKTERDDTRASRAKLYKRFARIVAKKYGYDLKDQDRGDVVAFLFDKKGGVN